MTSDSAGSSCENNPNMNAILPEKPFDDTIVEEIMLCGSSAIPLQVSLKVKEGIEHALIYREPTDNFNLARCGAWT